MRVNQSYAPGFVKIKKGILKIYQKDTCFNIITHARKAIIANAASGYLFYML